MFNLEERVRVFLDGKLLPGEWVITKEYDDDKYQVSQTIDGVVSMHENVSDEFILLDWDKEKMALLLTKKYISSAEKPEDVDFVMEFKNQLIYNGEDNDNRIIYHDQSIEGLSEQFMHVADDHDGMEAFFKSTFGYYSESHLVKVKDDGYYALIF